MYKPFLISLRTTFISCSGTETAKEALPLMKHLKALKLKYDLSILVLAHTPKRDLSKPITRNDLQGSKMLINFCDSSFAIGESFSDKHIRYIKQIKQRNCESVYDADNVIVCEIAKPLNFLQFEFIGYGAENEYLRVPNEKNEEDLITSIKLLHSKEKSIRDIANTLQLSKSKVHRIIQKHEQSIVSQQSHTSETGHVGQVKPIDTHLFNSVPSVPF